MSLGFTSQLNDPDLDRVSAALLRAGQRARELARQTGTGIAVEIDGELRIWTCPWRRAMKTDALDIDAEGLALFSPNPAHSWD